MIKEKDIEIQKHREAFKLNKAKVLENVKNNTTIDEKDERDSKKRN